jgi:pilus assembly protein FimV
VGGWIASGALLAAVSSQAWALGLGEIELNSALNEDLKAEIELFDAASLSPAEIKVSLASSEDFERVGVERFFFLTDLDFQVTYGPNGEAEVKVTSSRPITEPYLNFLVEVLWPNGRLLKEYTVLLDPPTFSDASAPAVAAPAETTRSPASAGRVERQQTQASTGTRVQMAPTPKRAPAPSPLDQDVVGDEFRMTDRDDTLWSIASRARPSSSVSVHQTMLAIQQLNPDAFIDGNINLLKAGYTLKLPDEAQAQQISQGDALAQVQRQNEAWRAIARGETPAETAAAPAAVAASQTADQTSNLRSPVDATTKAPVTSSAPAQEGELRIVAGAGDSATGRATQAADPGALTAALEEKDRLSREVDELTYKLDAQQELVDNQIAVKERQLEVKDQQIAQLQQQLKELKELQAQGANQPPAAKPASESPQSQNQNAQEKPQQSWWDNPLVLYGGAGALVLALVGGMLASRRRRNVDEDFFEQNQPTLDDSDEMEEAFAAADDEFEEDEDETLESTESGEAAPKSETSDIIGEADIYIAYGRYPQAIGLLLGVLDEDPERNDVRMKLLELYAETNDRDAFDEHLAQLVEHCDDEDALLSARELESRFGESSISLDDMLSGEAGDRSPGDGGDTVELDISEAEEPPAVTLEPYAEDSDSETTRLNGGEEAAEADFELELDELDAGETESRGAGDELGGDLGIDFDPDRDVAEELELDQDSAEEPLATAGFEALDEDATIRIGDEDRIDLDDMGISSDFDAGSSPAGGTERQTASDLDDDELALAEDDEFDFEDEGDSANTKLDLARAYIDMGDADGARDILKEVLSEGNSEQQQQAQSMLESL